MIGFLCLVAIGWVVAQPKKCMILATMFFHVWSAWAQVPHFTDTKGFCSLFLYCPSGRSHKSMVRNRTKGSTSCDGESCMHELPASCREQCLGVNIKCNLNAGNQKRDVDALGWRQSFQEWRIEWTYLSGIMLLNSTDITQSMTTYIDMERCKLCVRQNRWFFATLHAWLNNLAWFCIVRVRCLHAIRACFLHLLLQGQLQLPRSWCFRPMQLLPTRQRYWFGRAMPKPQEKTKID